MGNDLIYLRPASAEEAVAAWAEFAQGAGAHKDVRYLAGGTEIVTSSRKTAAPPHVLIDIARLPELRQREVSGNPWVLGAALTLNQAAEAPYPLLGTTVRHIADHTTRNRLTLGGNVAGALPYREAVLPLLLANATLVTLVPGAAGGAPERRERPLREAFDRKLHLDPGELVVAFTVPAQAARAEGRHHRATRTSPVDYPLVTACFSAGGVAVSGVLSYPAWFADLAAARLAFSVGGAIKSDQRGSAEYRLALFETMTLAQEAHQ